MEKNSLKAVLYSSFALKKTVVSLSKEREREKKKRRRRRQCALFGRRRKRDDDLLRVVCLSPLSFSFEGKKGSVGVEEEEEEIIS